jgi:hypothetical protein
VSKDSPSREAMTAYIRALGNPYAKLQIMGEEEQQELELELRAPTQVESEYARLLENQYALLSIALADPVPTVAPTDSTAKKTQLQLNSEGILSKRDFDIGCRRIFRPYIPSVEKKHLRRHHRDFIVRNVNRSPSERYLLLKELSKYDLSALPGMEARFNREREDLTDEKLKLIERSVSSKDSK